MGLLCGFCFAKAGEEPVRISAAQVSGDAAKKITYLAGNVRIIQGKTTITTEYIAIHLDQKNALLDKGTRLANPDVTIDSRSLQYNLKQKTGTFREQVFLKRIESGDSVKKEPFELASAELYFETDTRNFKADGNCRLKHQQFEGTANCIEYDDAGQKLDFKGDVMIRQGVALIKSESIIVDMSKKQLRLETKIDLISRDIKIAAESLSYDYEQQTGVFPEEVVLTMTETKNAKGRVIKEPFTLKAARLYFETRSNNFMAGNGRIEHQEFTGSAEKIEYDDGRQLVTFKGNARLTRIQGEELHGEQIEINLRDQCVMVHQSGAVTLKIREEK